MVARLGDLWELGDHRLLCGDATSAADVDRVMAGDRARLVATDPPYLVNYTGERRAKGRSAGKDWSHLYREISGDQAGPFFRAVFDQVVRVLDDRGAVYCWHAHRRVGLLQQIWTDVGLLDHQLLVWVKPTRVFGRCMYHHQHELCLFGWRKGSKPRHDGRGDLTSVWTVAGVDVEASPASDVWCADWEGKRRVVGNEHPTQKPVELFARPMRKHTLAGEICFEPFSGSGSQLVAAEQLGRRCRAIEIQPAFVDVAIRRWQTVTGKPATLEGRTYDQVARTRG
ncbi:MAG: site-specific DNA-methyltransferase [Vicinamibacterales bacterium]